MITHINWGDLGPIKLWLYQTPTDDTTLHIGIGRPPPILPLTEWEYEVKEPHLAAWLFGIAKVDTEYRLQTLFALKCNDCLQLTLRPFIYSARAERHPHIMHYFICHVV